MQSVLIMQCFICKVSLLCSALYAKCPYYSVIYTQSVLIVQWFILKCPYYSVLYTQSVRIIQWFIRKGSLLFSDLYANVLIILWFICKCPYYSVICTQMSLLFSDLYAKCPYYSVICTQSVLFASFFLGWAVCIRGLYPLWEETLLLGVSFQGFVC